MKNDKRIKYVSIAVVVGIVLGLSIFGVKNLLDSYESDNTQANIEYVSKYFTNETLDTNDDFLSLQETSNDIISDAIDEKYSLEEASVIVNPYEISPLTAVIIFETDSEQTVELTISNETYYFESSTSHAIPIYGLVAGKVNTVTITSGTETKDFEIDMTDVVFDIDVDVLVNEGELYDGVYLFTNPLEEGAYAINEAGEVIWHLDSDFTLTPIVLENGHLLLSSSDFSSDLYNRNGIIEIDYLGKIYNYYEVEGGYHHDMELLPSGNLLVASSEVDGDTNLDYLVEINLETGKTVKEISLKDILSDIDSSIVDSEDWFFNNGVSFDENTNSILVSTRLKNSVISIDYDSLDINWIFGDSEYWSSKFDSYLISYDGEYPLGMHSAELNSDGNLIMYNNNYDKSNPQVSNYYTDYNSSVQIYNINTSTMSANLVSEFDDNESFFSYAVSTYKELDNGNYIVYSGWEIDKNTFDDEYDLNYFVSGNTTMLYELDEDNNILYKAEISISSYAGIKTNFYQEINDNVDVSDLDYNSNYEKESYTTVDLDDIKSQLETAEDFAYSYLLTNNSFSLIAGLLEEDVVNIYFVKSDGTVAMYNLKEKNETLTYYLDIQDLYGEYAMFLEVNGDFYNYNLTYNFR